MNPPTPNPDPVPHDPQHPTPPTTPNGEQGVHGQATDSSATAHAKKRFLDAFCKLGIILEAARAAGIDRSSHYRWLKQDPQYAIRFGHATEDAADLLEVEMVRRAVEGQRQYKFGPDGKPLRWHGPDGSWEESRHYFEDKRSDALLIFALKARRPERFRERFAIETSGPGGGPISVIQNQIPLVRHLQAKHPELLHRMREAIEELGNGEDSEGHGDG